IGESWRREWDFIALGRDPGGSRYLKCNPNGTRRTQAIFDLARARQGTRAKLRIPVETHIKNSTKHLESSRRWSNLNLRPSQVRPGGLFRFVSLDHELVANFGPAPKNCVSR